MSTKAPVIEVFGADIMCASCVNARRLRIHTNGYKQLSRANIQIKTFSIRYIDIEGAIENERDQDFANRIQEDEFFYPLVLINDEVVGEGYVQIKPIFPALENAGFIPIEE